MTFEVLPDYEILVFGFVVFFWVDVDDDFGLGGEFVYRLFPMLRSKDCTWMSCCESESLLVRDASIGFAAFMAFFY